MSKRPLYEDACPHPNFTDEDIEICIDSRWPEELKSEVRTMLREIWSRPILPLTDEEIQRLEDEPDVNIVDTVENKRVLRQIREHNKGTFLYRCPVCGTIQCGPTEAKTLRVVRDTPCRKNCCKTRGKYKNRRFRTEEDETLFRKYWSKKRNLKSD